MKITFLYVNDYSIAHYGKNRKEFPPIGLLYLAAACEKKNIEVRLTDLNSKAFNQLEFSEIIGLSINSTYVYPHFLRKLDQIKKKCKYLIVGGQHPTLFPKQTFSELNPSIIIVGEGEEILPEIIGDLLSKKKRQINHPNVLTKETIEQKDFIRKHRILELDRVPFPARHLLKKEDILLDKRVFRNDDIKAISMITSRGCPHGCKFCGNVYKKFSARSAHNVELEIIHLIENYPEMGGIVFLDENLLFDRSHAVEICKVMNKYRLKWTCNARIDSFTEDIANDLKESGCIEIKYGIESGSQKILNAMNKNITLQDISKTLKITHQNGIGTKCFMLFGYPGDGLISAKETIKFLQIHKKYIDRVNLFNFAPLPGSPIYEECGYSKKKIEFKKFKIYGQAENWWGDDKQEDYLNGYQLLSEYINANFHS